MEKFWRFIKEWLNVTGVAIEVAEVVGDTGYRECLDGKYCADEKCTHKELHEKNTGCNNACFKNNRVCDIVRQVQTKER